MVHLQLTRHCNLRCHFCGQWGKNGFFAQDRDADLSVAEWTGVIESLLRYRDSTGISPDIMLWGGEPLVSPAFPQLVSLLQKHHFTLGLVTNGVLLDRYADIIKDGFKTVYISIDGPAETHNRIRGTGIFEQVSANIKRIRNGQAGIVFMTVISPDNLDIAPEIPRLLTPLAPDKILLQQMIFLSTPEIAAYADWLKKTFNQDAREIYAWETAHGERYLQRLRQQVEQINRNIRAGVYLVPVELVTHGPGSPETYCISPFHHLHVGYNGNVLYCTDFYDFKAGNVLRHDLIDIFHNELSKRFRLEIASGNCPSCNHCAWRGNQNYRLDECIFNQ